MDDLLTLMRSRRSVRRFLPRMPDREVLERLIEAAITAPSASNRQPWRFLIVTGRERIGALAAAVREATGRIVDQVDPAFRDAFREYGDYFTRFEEAPAVIVPLCRELATLSQMVGDGLAQADRDQIVAMESESGLISASLAVQNLLLAAHAVGLGASCMTGPLIAAPRLRELLGVTGAWKLVALIPVGFGAQEPVPTARKPASTVIRWLT